MDKVLIFLFGMLSGVIVLALAFAFTTGFYHNGWEDAEIYHLQNNRTKYHYELQIDSTYIKE